MRRSARFAMAGTILSAAFWGWAVQASAQELPATPAPNPSIVLADEAAREGVFAFDFAVPTSPALALAGLSQDKATVQSSSLKPFVFSLPAVVSGGGGQSAALDMSPAWLFEGEPGRSYSNYVGGSYFYRLMYRTRINAALYNGTNDKVDPKKAKGSRLAFGLSASLLDSSDPLMAGGRGSRSAWQRCLAEQQPKIDALFAYRSPTRDSIERLVPVLAQARGLSVEAGQGARPSQEQVGLFEKALGISVSFDGLDNVQAVRKLVEVSIALEKQIGLLEDEDAKYAAGQALGLGLDTSLKTCATRASNAAMFAPALSVGAGRLLRGEPGKLDDFDGGGTVLWSSFRVPVAILYSDKDEVTQFVAAGVFVRRGFGEYLATGDTTVPEFKANTWDYWSGIEVYSQVSKFALQVGRSEMDARLSAEDQFSRKKTRYLVSGAVPILGRSTGLWLGASYGNARSTVSTENDRTFMITLEFGPPKPTGTLGLKK